MDIRAIQAEAQAQQAEQMRNEAALAALRGEETVPAPAMPGAHVPMLPPPPAPAPVTATSIISDARARCAILRAELLQLEAKRGELAMLERMIASTEGAKDG